MMRMEYRISSRGNIAVIVAVSLAVLVSMLALVVDGGYLFETKDEYQNGVEAAALAGAHHFGDGNDSSGLPLALKTAKTIAEENGIPSGAIVVEIGFYDESSAGFEPDPDPSTAWNDAVSTAADPTYNNAVRVTANDTVSTFLGGIFGKDTVNVSVGAVAYGSRYTFMSTGLGGDGIDVHQKWRPGFPVYKNCLFGSNGPVRFAGAAYETFENSRVEAMGEVSGADGKIDVTTLTAPLKAPTIDWSALRKQAMENGVVYTAAELESWPDTWTADALGNHHKRCEAHLYGRNYITYLFLPAGRDNDDPGNTAYEGDHHGRTYYFDVPSTPKPGFSDGYVVRVWNSAPWPDYVVAPGKRTCWNFTIAAPCCFSTYPYPAAAAYGRITTTLGNFPEYGDAGLVYIYAASCTGYSSNWYTRYAGAKLTEPNGVVFHAEGHFEMYSQRCYNTTYYFRVYANGIRIYDPGFGGLAENVFDGAFGPLDNIRLGKG